MSKLANKQWQKNKKYNKFTKRDESSKVLLAAAGRENCVLSTFTELCGDFALRKKVTKKLLTGCKEAVC